MSNKIKISNEFVHKNNKIIGFLYLFLFGLKGWFLATERRREELEPTLSLDIHNNYSWMDFSIIIVWTFKKYRAKLPFANNEKNYRVSATPTRFKSILPVWIRRRKI